MVDSLAYIGKIFRVLIETKYFEEKQFAGQLRA